MEYLESKNEEKITWIKSDVTNTYRLHENTSSRKKKHYKEHKHNQYVSFKDLGYHVFHYDEHVFCMWDANLTINQHSEPLTASTSSKEK